MSGGYLNPIMDAGRTLGFGDLSPPASASPYAYTNGPGTPFQPMPAFAPPSFGPSFNIPGVGDLSLLSVFSGGGFGSMPPLVGGTGVFSPAQVMAGSAYYRESNLAAGVRLPGYSEDVNRQMVQDMTDRMARISETFAGGRTGMAEANLARIDDAVRKEFLEVEKRDREEVRRRGLDMETYEVEALAKRERFIEENIGDRQTIQEEIRERAGMDSDRLTRLLTGPGMTGAVGRGVLSAMGSNPFIGPMLEELLGAEQIFMGPRVHTALSTAGFGGGRMQGGASGILASEVARDIISSMRTAGVGEGGEATYRTNFEFTRGFSASQLGDIMTESARRGILMDVSGGGPGASILSDQQTEVEQYRIVKERTKAQLEKMTSVMDEVREIFGPGKSMEELFNALDAMTGGGLAQLSPGEVQQMVRRVRETAEITGMTSEAVAMTTAQAAAQARQMGLAPTVGVQTAMTAMEQAAAIAQVRGVTSGSYFGAMNQTDMAALIQRDLLSFQNSEGATTVGQAGVMIRNAAAAAGIEVREDMSITDTLAEMRRQNVLGRRGDELYGLFARMEDPDRQLTEADLDMLDNKVRMRDLLAGALRSDPGRTGQYLETRTLGGMAVVAGLPEVALRIQRRDTLTQLEKPVSVIMREAFARQGLTGGAGVAGGLIRAALGSESSDQFEVIQSLQDFLEGTGITDEGQLRELSRAAYEAIDTSLSSGRGGVRPQSIREFLERNGDQQIERLARQRQDARSVMGLDERLRARGLGRQGIVRRVIDDFITTDPEGLKGGETLGGFARSALGVMGSEQVIQGFEDLGEQYFQEIRDAQKVIDDPKAGYEERVKASRDIDRIWKDIAANESLAEKYGQLFGDLNIDYARQQRMGGEDLTRKIGGDVEAIRRLMEETPEERAARVKEREAAQEKDQPSPKPDKEAREAEESRSDQQAGLSREVLLKLNTGIGIGTLSDVPNVHTGGWADPLGMGSVV